MRQMHAQSLRMEHRILSNINPPGEAKNEPGERQRLEKIANRHVIFIILQQLTDEELCIT